MAREPQSEAGHVELAKAPIALVEGSPELIDSPIKGIDLASLNVLTAVSFGILVGQQAIRQVLSGGPGPLGERKRNG